MYLIDHAYRVVPARAEPLRTEDPFTALAHPQLTGLLANVRARRGPDVRLAVTFANCFGGWTFCDPQARNLSERGPRSVSTFLSVAWFPAAAQGQVTIRHGLRVPALTFSTTFFAFHDALTVARHWLDTGSCDVVLAGAAESVGSPFLADAVGPDAVNDAAAWFVLAAAGEAREPVVRTPATPPPADGGTLVADAAVDGTPMDGACALPLLMLSALRDAPRTLRIPGRAVIRAGHRSLDVWRNG